MNTLVWLASYPKSGNTWMRSFLANYLRDGDEPVDINQLNQIFTASTRWAFDLTAGFSSSNLPIAAVDVLRPQIYRHYAQIDDTLKFLKVHDTYRILPSGDSLFPVEATRGAIYIVRNPLDVAVSYAYHLDANFDDTIAAMNDPEARLADNPRALQAQFPQWLGTWSNHVTEWMACTGMPLHVVRYEDLLTQPSETFKAILRFLGFADDDTRLEKAIRFSSFKELRQQEAKKTFYERMNTKTPFFRRGKSGSWQDELTPAQIEQVTADHHAVMTQFGYFPL